MKSAKAPLCAAMVLAIITNVTVLPIVSLILPRTHMSVFVMRVMWVMDSLVRNSQLQTTAKKATHV
jgi:hypothetical protein